MTNQRGWWPRAKKLFAGYLILVGVYTPFAELFRPGASVGSILVIFVLGLGMAWFGLWAWRALPRWQELFPRG